MKINQEELKRIIEKLQKVKEDVKNSNHDALSVDGDSDFKPDEDSLNNWFKAFDLPKASDESELPKEYWKSIFDLDEVDQDQYDLITVTEEYNTLLSLYLDVYSDVYTACMEECAYYEKEAEDHENYLDSMRGPL